MSTMAKTAVTWPQRIFVADIGWPSNGSTQLEGLCPLSGIQYRCAEHRTAAHVGEGILILRSDQRTNSRLRPKLHSTPPPGIMTRERCRPRCCSKAGRHEPTRESLRSRSVVHRTTLAVILHRCL